MNKTLLIIPGFRETTKEKPYREIIRFAKISGYKTIIKINPTWNHKTSTDWYNMAIHKIKNIDCENTVAVGFSLGAYILLLLSRNNKFKKMLFCSISPFFAEQIHKLPPSAQTFLGKRRLHDFKKYRLPERLKTTQNIFFFGESDWKFAITEAEKYATKQKSSFTLIKDTGHELTSIYIEKIKNNLI